MSNQLTDFGRGGGVCGGGGAVNLLIYVIGIAEVLCTHHKSVGTETYHPIKWKYKYNINLYLFMIFSVLKGPSRD